MIEVIFLFSLALVWVAFAAVQDIKEQEVANWISLSLVIFALGFRFFFCLFSETGIGKGFGFFYQGLIGLAVFFVLGNLFYYSKLFAGGDAKMFIALGAVLPLSTSFFGNILYLLYFIIIFLFVGAVYGMSISIFLVARNFNAFKSQFKKRFKAMENLIVMNMFFALFLIILGITEITFLILGLLILLLPFLYVYAKSVDESCSVKRVPVSKLKEGDWLYEDVKIRKGKGKTKAKFIRAKWEGLSKKEIKALKKKFKSKKIKVRYGIAFIPAMLISLVVFMVSFLAAII